MELNLTNFPSLNEKLASMTDCPELRFVGPLPIEASLNAGHLKSDTPSIFLDGGLKHFPKSPDPEWTSLVIGDNDSEEQHSPEAFDLLLETKKDQSDFAVALNLLRSTQSKSSLFRMYGLLGGRLDHQLAIFGELSQYMKGLDRDSCAHFYDSKSGKISISLFRGELTENVQGTFSLMATEESIVSITGALEYPLQQRNLSTLSSLGLSNKGLGEIHFSVDQPTLLLRNAG